MGAERLGDRSEVGGDGRFYEVRWAKVQGTDQPGAPRRPGVEHVRGFDVGADQSVDEFGEPRLSGRFARSNSSRRRALRGGRMRAHSFGESLPTTEVVVHCAGVGAGPAHDLAQRSRLDTRIGELGLGGVEQGVNPRAAHS